MMQLLRNISFLISILFQRFEMNHRKGPTFCPTINADSDGNEIFVKSGARKSISFRVNVIAQLIMENPLICQFDFENRSINASGRLLSDTVYCDGTNFEIASKITGVKAEVKIFWDGWKTLENPDNIQSKRNSRIRAAGTGVMNFSFFQFWYFSAKTFRSIVTLVSLCRKNQVVAGVHLSRNAAFVRSVRKI